MADDEVAEDGTAPPSSVESGVVPVHVMPEDILQNWTKLPGSTVINVAFSKQDLDNLFFAIANTHNAIDVTNRAFVQWSNGQVKKAQVNLESSRHSIVVGMNCLRFFFEAIVRGMVRGGQSG